MHQERGEHCGKSANPAAAPKACSGKCKTPCGSATRVWVVAACEGMLSLFEKTVDAKLKLMPQSEQSVFSSLDNFRDVLALAEDRNQFDQLILVGGGSDIAWVQMSLPSSVSKHIVAEIKYPLIAAWFTSSPTQPQLTQALENLLLH